MQNDSAMHSNDGFKVFLNKMIRRNRKEAKRGMEISAPSTSKSATSTSPASAPMKHITRDLGTNTTPRIAMLKEQAVASRIGIADFDSADYPARPLFAIQPVMSSASISTIRSSYSS
ncbi:hypothetical protein Ct61P_03439 [Colletotrichum tofieldiae]|nr:hypothetical protein Ct61P_03439 [Colletotrichum tofieldiae]